MKKQIYNNKEEEYRQHPGINVSKLKTWDDYVEAAKKLRYCQYGTKKFV